MQGLSDILTSALLSLRQISDRLKALVTNTVTKSEATVDKQEIIETVSAEVVEAVGTIKNSLQGSNSEATLSYLYDQIGDLSSLLDEINERLGNNSGIPLVMVPNETPTQELTPNTCYMFVNRTNDLSITLGEPLEDVVSEYHMFLYIGETVPTVTFPQDVDFGFEFVMSPEYVNSCIEISILDNKGVCVVW